VAHLIVAALGFDNRIVSNGASPSKLYQPWLIYQIRAYLVPLVRVAFAPWS